MNASVTPHEGHPMRIIEQLAGDPLRGAFERLVRSRYSAVHGAALCHFMPHLLGCVNADQQPLAVLGYRDAGEGPLFLEQYLDTPIEHALTDRRTAAGAVSGALRHRIVEVGNLASCDRRATAELLRALPRFLLRKGFEWLVFTGTPQVREIVAAFGAPLLDLGGADSTRLQDNATEWGRYYDSAPRVMAGRLDHRNQAAA